MVAEHVLRAARARDRLRRAGAAARPRERGRGRATFGHLRAAALRPPPRPRRRLPRLALRECRARLGNLRRRHRHASVVIVPAQALY
eukprot:1192196-Prorocentrum_minimum.AAC.2